MMSYNTLQKENMMLYNALAKQTKKMDILHNIVKKINFFDISYKEMYEILSKIVEIIEE